MIDAARRASAYKIVAVMPYFGFARQDRKDKPRVSIAAKAMANLLTASGVDRIITMDLHADQIQGFFDVPVDHLFASAVHIPYLRQLDIDNLAIASPDVGGSKRANAYAHHLGTDLIICHKTRFKANEVQHIKVIGDPEGKNVILVDDMIDTAGTISKAADVIKDQGAKSIRVIATHAILSGPSIERIENSSIDEVIVTDTVPYNGNCKKIRVLTVADVFADVIRKVYTFQSISSNFIFR
jgi:ribose-phosphate pyrophosphokinase